MAGRGADSGERRSSTSIGEITGRGLDRSFTTFIKRVGRVATDLLLTTAERLQAAATSTRPDVLQTFLVRGSLDDAAATLDCKTLPLEFFPRALMQPLAEALTGQPPECCSPPAQRGTDGARGSPAQPVPVVAGRLAWPSYEGRLRQRGGSCLFAHSVHTSGRFLVPDVRAVVKRVPSSWSITSVRFGRMCGLKSAGRIKST